MNHSRFFVYSLFFSFVVALVFGSALSVQAATRSWIGGQTTQVSDALNWSGGALPVSGDSLVFPSGNTIRWDLSGIVPSSIENNANFSLQTPLAVSNSMRLLGGSLALNSQSLNVGGDLLIEGGSFDGSGSTIYVSGNWNYTSGTLNLASANVVMAGGGTKTIVSSGRHFGGLSVSSGALVNMADDLFVDNTLNITDGTLAIGSKTATFQGNVVLTGGALSVDSGSIILSGTTGRPLSVLGGRFSAAPTSLVEYRPVSGGIVIEPLNYGNLKLAGNAVFSLSGATTVDGTLTIEAAATLSLGGGELKIPSGLFVNNGTVTDGKIICPALSLRVLNSSGSEISSINSSSSTLIVAVEDQNLNRKGSSIESVPMALTITTLNGDKEMVGIKESSAASGVFKSDALVAHQGSPTQGNGQIELGQNDIVFVTYTDPDDISDSKKLQLKVVLANSSSSGAPQIVIEPTVSSWNGLNTGSGTTYSGHILWTTDVLSTSAVTVTSPQMTSPISAGSLTGVTEHDVLVSGLVRGREYSFTVTSVGATGGSVTSKPKQFKVIVSGDRIKTASSPAVYWYLNGRRNVFSDFTSYDSWFDSWNGVVVIPTGQMSDISLGKVVPVRAGTYLVKIQSDPRTYVVELFGTLRWIKTESQAIALYGTNWSTRVRDLDVSQFTNYSSGEPLLPEEVPSGFVYRTNGGEMNVVIGNTAHALPETSRQINGLFSRFVSTISPSVVSSLPSGAAISGYDPDLNGVLLQDLTHVIAPAAGF